MQCIKKYQQKKKLKINRKLNENKNKNKIINTKESISISININKKEKRNKLLRFSMINKKSHERNSKKIKSNIPLFKPKKDTLKSFSIQQRKNTIYKKVLKLNIKKNNISEENLDCYNLSPYTKVLREDKRNILQIIKSFTFKKIELINIYTSDGSFKEIEICQYILSLLIDFFFNALLYSDEVISNKYHNNGKLDFIVPLVVSLLSNILTSIIIYFIKLSENFEEKYDDISKIRNEKQYLYAFGKFLKYVRLGMIIFIFEELIIIFFSFYFIIIFCIIYNKSRLSLLYNYFSSLLQGFIKSLIVITLIVITRKIGINSRNKYIFNTSKYIDQNL